MMFHEVFGVSRIDISELEARANSFNQISPYIPVEDFDTFQSIIDDLNDVADKKIGDKPCGIHALVTYGCDGSSKNSSEAIDAHGSIFIGRYQEVAIINARVQTLPGSSAITSCMPAIMFDPVEPEEVPRLIYDRYSGIVGGKYPHVAVPLIGLPVIVEHVPQIIDN